MRPSRPRRLGIARLALGQFFSLQNSKKNQNWSFQLTNARLPDVINCKPPDTRPFPHAVTISPVSFRWKRRATTGVPSLHRSDLFRTWLSRLGKYCPFLFLKDVESSKSDCNNQHISRARPQGFEHELMHELGSNNHPTIRSDCS